MGAKVNVKPKYNQYVGSAPLGFDDMVARTNVNQAARHKILPVSPNLFTNCLGEEMPTQVEFGLLGCIWQTSQSRKYRCPVLTLTQVCFRKLVGLLLHEGVPRKECHANKRLLFGRETHRL